MRLGEIKVTDDEENTEKQKARNESVDTVWTKAEM